MLQHLATVSLGISRVHIANNYCRLKFLFLPLGCNFRKLILKGFRVSHIIKIKASHGVQIIYLKSMYIRGQEGHPKRTGLQSSPSEVTLLIIIMVLNSNQNTVRGQINKNCYYYQVTYITTFMIQQGQSPSKFQ